jgi:hypothetical protein
MFQKKLSKEIDDILLTVNVDLQENVKVRQTPNTPCKEVLHETVEVILNNRKFNDSLSEDLDLSEDSFRRITNVTLKEYVEQKGYSYTTRNQTIRLLFETNNIDQDTIFFLEEKQNKEDQENKLIGLVEEFDDSLDDEFETKYGDDLDFRTIKGKQTICDDSITYNKLNTMSERDWEEYVSVLNDNGVQCYYDSVNDCFIVNKYNSNEGVERFNVEPEDSMLIENIVKQTAFNLVEVRGSSKSTGKEYIIETVVEKDGYKTVIEYHDTSLRKPWKIAGAQFQFLQEAIKSINIPYAQLHNEKISVVKKRTLLEEITKKYNNKTDNLPLSESQKREY